MLAFLFLNYYHRPSIKIRRKENNMARKKVLNVGGNSKNIPLSDIYKSWEEVSFNINELNKSTPNSYNAVYYNILDDAIDQKYFKLINDLLTSDGFLHVTLSTKNINLTEDALVNILIKEGFYQVYTDTSDSFIILAIAFKNKPSNQQLKEVGIYIEKNNKPAYLPEYTKPETNSVSNFFYPVFWGTENPQNVVDTISEITKKIAPGYHFADNFFTWFRNMSMFDDKPFVKAWQSNLESPSDQAIVWRRYVLACAAYHCVQLEGDFVECGAYTGVGIKTIIDYLGGTNFPKMFWGYDLFEHNESMLNHAMPEHGEGLYERVQEKFIDYPQVEIIKGFIPDCFEDNCPEKIAYLHIDLNQAPAEIAALEHLFDRVVPGGIIILDDYEWSGIYRPQKLAEDEWFEQRNYKVMPLPTGQGLVFKR